MKRHELTPYPTAFPEAAARILVEKLRGMGDHKSCCLVHACHELLGYAFGQFMPDDGHDVPANVYAAGPKLTNEELADQLEAACQGEAPKARATRGKASKAAKAADATEAAAVGAFDWAQIIQALLTILLPLLKPQTP